MLCSERSNKKDFSEGMFNKHKFNKCNEGQNFFCKK